MKELSIKEKAERYEKALMWMYGLYPTMEGAMKEDAEHYFPELKESEDELKWLTRFIEEEAHCLSMDIRDDEDRIKLKNLQKSLAWLEKQGEQNHANSTKTCEDEQKTVEWHREDEQNLNTCLSYIPDEYLRRWLVDVVHVKYDKPADKVEPKFHEGEWIVWQDKCYKVNYNGCGYELIDQNGLRTSLEYGTVDKSASAFTIQDAKNGDVLASNSSTFLFSQEYMGGKPEAHCGIMNGFFIAKPEGCWTNEKIYPATKEQRDTLMKAIADAGYTFDFDKKDLKKIEQNPAWSEEDEIRLKHILHLLDVKDDKRYILRFGLNSLQKLEKDIAWLRFLKDRVQPQPKQEWSKEDEAIFDKVEVLLDTLCDYLEDSSSESIPDIKDVITKLKSFKSRIKPKWSEEDEKMLDLIIAIFEVNHPNGHFKANELNDPNMRCVYTEEIVTWLKSLKERVACEANCTTTKQWKPSEEQVKVLEFFIPYVTKCSIVLQKSKDTLLSLLADLKKLR